jgi:hypothetical protein
VEAFQVKRIVSILALGVVTAVTTAGLTNRNPDGLVVHEWGTFTTVAGTDGRAIEWLPLGGPTDLPCFVSHWGNVLYKVWPAGGAQPLVPLTYDAARGSLWGKVRMETPVIYFYSDKDVTTTVSVTFPRGLITEFYPYGLSNSGPPSGGALRDPSLTGYVEWRNVRIGPSVPALFPNGGGQSHYYAARATDASPLKVGNQHEKFLFYRGVASFDVPIQTIALEDGAVEVSNLSADGPLPNVVLFENRGGKIGYRINGSLGLRKSVTLAAPKLDGSVATLRGDLEQMLVAAGLYPKEAAAMVDTWRDSWFEEGTRVFYIVPSRSVDAILPLYVSTKPASVARVFVGRMDVITPATIQIVEQALKTNDAATLAGYSRFLSPITDRITARGTDGVMNSRIRDASNAAFATYVNRSRICE